MTRPSSPHSLRELPLADPGVADARSGDRLLLWIARGQRWTLLLGVTWGMVWMGAQAAVPAALGAGVQAAANRDPAMVSRWAIVVLVLGAVQAVAGILRHRMAVANWIIAASRIQQLVARRASDLGSELSRQVSTGEVVAVTASDVERVGSAFDVAARFAGAIFAFIAVAIVLISTSPTLGLIVLIGLPLLSLVILPLLRPLERRESTQRGYSGAASAIAADTISGLRVLRGIGGERIFVERYQQASQQVRTAAVSTSRVRSLLDALQVLLPGIFVVLITYLGARLALTGVLSVGELVAFYGYTAFLVLPLRTVTETADKWTRARVAARRVARVLSLERRDAGVELGTENSSEIDVDPVHLHLTDSLSGISTTPGSLIGVVCSGPDIAERVIDRLGGYGERDGNVELNGRPLTAFSLDELRSLVVVQDKDPVILSGRLRDLLVVPGANPFALPESVWAASADDVVEGLGGDPADIATGYEVELPERGRTLSGGQRQRLSLVRSLLAAPPILILDDPTSAVDAHTEARISERLKQSREHLTTVVFATSPLMLDRCDRVLFAPHGVVVDEGRHHHLVHTNAEYRATVIREVT